MSPTQLQFTNVREFIVILLFLYNAWRTWVLPNMTMKELWQVKCKDESWRVNHKTLTTLGTTHDSFKRHVVLTHDFFKKLDTFVFLMRLCLEGIDDSNVDSDHWPFQKLEWNKNMAINDDCTNQLLLSPNCR